MASRTRPFVLGDEPEAGADQEAYRALRLWRCPDPTHRSVRWRAGWARCGEPACLQLSAGFRVAVCDNYREDLDRPCRGYLIFKPEDLDAPCLACGGRCGRLVASYLTS